jgi:hypothetical protein
MHLFGLSTGATADFRHRFARDPVCFYKFFVVQERFGKVVSDLRA